MQRKRVKLHSLGKKIKYLRQNKKLSPEESGYTQEQFADLLNVSVDTVKNWEQGYNYPSIDMIVQLCSLFECDFDYLLGSQERPQKYIGLSDAAGKTLYDLHKSKSIHCKTISDLIENVDLILLISRLSTAHYAHFSFLEQDIPFYPEPLMIGFRELACADIMRLFLLLLSYINEKRKESGLETFTEYLRLFQE